MTPEQAQQNLAAIINEYLGDLQRNGKGASASLLKNAADEALAVIENALKPGPGCSAVLDNNALKPGPGCSAVLDNKDESHA